MTTPTSHLITVKDEWGTPVNPHPYNKWMRPGDFSYMQYNDFALNNPPLPAPGIKDSIEPVMAEVHTQIINNNEWPAGSPTREIYTLSPEAPVVGEKKQQMPSDNPECDWKEDAGHENGNYTCHCVRCLKNFTGHKRRVICKVCVGEKSGGEGVEPVDEKEKFITDLIHTLQMAPEYFEPKEWIDRATVLLTTKQ